MCTPLIVIASTSLTRYVAKWDINYIDLNHDEAGKKREGRRFSNLLHETVLMAIAGWLEPTLRNR